MAGQSMSEPTTIVHLVNVYQHGSVAKIIGALAKQASPSFRHVVVALDLPIRPLSEQEALPNAVACSRYDLRLIIEAIQKVGGCQPALIHAHMGWATLMGPLVARRLKIPSLTTFHGERMHYSLGIRWGVRILARFAGQDGEGCGFTGVSETVSSQWSAFLGRHVSAIYNPLLLPVALARSTTTQRVEPLRLISVARLNTAKNLEFGLDVVAALKRRGVDCVYTIVGEGPEHDALRVRTAALKLIDTVTFSGYQQDVLPFLDQADVFLLPSFQEGFCMAAVEAMARGCTVMTHAGLLAVLEFIADGTNGIVMPDLSVEPWAARLQGLAQAPKELSRLQEQAIDAAGVFSPEAMTLGYEALYGVLVH